MSINGIMISENAARRSFIVNIRCGGLLVTMLLLIGSIAAPVSVAQSARDDQRERMQSEIWELQQELAKLRQIRTLELIEQTYLCPYIRRNGMRSDL